MKFALISTFGSVIAKQDLIFPSKSGCSHLSCGKIIIKAGKVQLKSELKSINITVWLFSSRNNMKRYNFKFHQRCLGIIPFVRLCRI